MDPGGQVLDHEKHELVQQLTDPETREAALLELSKRRESFGDVAPLLWHSFGTLAALLQEIIAIYPLLSPPSLTAHASNRVCNALALLQCVASHPDTRTLFLNAHIPYVTVRRPCSAPRAAAPGCCRVSARAALRAGAAAVADGRPLRAGCSCTRF